MTEKDLPHQLDSKLFSFFKDLKKLCTYSKFTFNLIHIFFNFSHKNFVSFFKIFFFFTFLLFLFFVNGMDDFFDFWG